MASEKPATVWQHDIYVPQSGRVISLRAYEGGLVSIAVAERTGPVVQALSIVLEGADRDEFDHAYQEACRRADGEPPAMEAPMLEAAGLCVQRAESAAGLNVYACTERLGHDDDGWHYDPLASEWWRRTADGVEQVKDPRHRT